MIGAMIETLLPALMGLFVIVLVLRVVKAMVFARQFSREESSIPAGASEELAALMRDAETSGKYRDVLRTIENRTAGMTSPAVRATYHCAAGNLARNRLKRPGLAVGFYLKALRADPTCIEAIGRLQEILVPQKRLRRLEWTYWEVLGRLNDGEAGGEMWLLCWSGLTAIYSTSPRTVRRADAIRKMLAAFGSDSDDERLNPISRLKGRSQA